MDNFDGLIKFKHDSAWVNKKIKKIIPKSYFSNENMNPLEIKKVYCPFYRFTVKGNVHDFCSFSHSSGYYETLYYTYNENDFDIESEVIMSANNIIEKDYGSDYHFERNRNYKDMTDFENDGATFLEFMEIDDDFKHCKDVLYKNKDTSLKNYEILESLRNPFHEYSRTNTSVISYDITDIKKYYYPMWIVSSSGFQKTYYIDDVSGSINGKNMLIDKAIYILLAFLVTIMVLLLVSWSLSSIITIDPSIYIALSGLPIIVIMVYLVVMEIPYVYSYYLHRKTIIIKKNLFKSIVSKEKFNKAIEEYLKTKF